MEDGAEARGAEFFGGWIEEMHKGGREDHTRAKVATDVVDPVRDAAARETLGDDGEEGGTEGRDEDDKDGADADAVGAAALGVGVAEISIAAAGH